MSSHRFAGPIRALTMREILKVSDDLAHLAPGGPGRVHRSRKVEATEQLVFSSVRVFPVVSRTNGDNSETNLHYFSAPLLV